MEKFIPEIQEVGRYRLVSYTWYSSELKEYLISNTLFKGKRVMWKNPSSKQIPDIYLLIRSLEAQNL